MVRVERQEQAKSESLVAHRLILTRINHVAGSEPRMLPGLSLEERVVVLDVDLHGLVDRHGWLSLFPVPRGRGFDTTRTTGATA
jgi:hypothetical protein